MSHMAQLSCFGLSSKVVPLFIMWSREATLRYTIKHGIDVWQGCRRMLLACALYNLELFLLFAAEDVRNTIFNHRYS